VNHCPSTVIELTANGAQELVERDLSVLVAIEVLHNLGNLNFAER
jgi:hypothetical protein